MTFPRDWLEDWSIKTEVRVDVMLSQIFQLYRFFILFLFVSLKKLRKGLSSEQMPSQNPRKYLRWRAFGTIVSKLSILDVCRGSSYASDDSTLILHAVSYLRKNIKKNELYRYNINLKTKQMGLSSKYDDNNKWWNLESLAFQSF